MTTSQLPAHLQKYAAPDLATTLSANLGSAIPPHVSIGGGRFTLIDAGNNEIPVPTFDPQIGVYLDACIVDVNDKMSRIYFAGAYDPNQEGARPDCFSDNGVAPSVSASAPQALTCTPDPNARDMMPDPTGARGSRGCFWAVWGSKINPNNKAVPACSQKQKVALLIPGHNTLFLLAVPPASHSYLREYVAKCKGSGVNIADVITRIYFVPGVQGTLAFSGVNYIDEATAQLRQAAYNEKRTDALVGRTDVPRQALAAPLQQGQLAPPNSTGQAPLLSTQQGSTMHQPAFPTAQVQQSAPFNPAPAVASPGSTQPIQPIGAPSVAIPAEPAPQRRRRRTPAEAAGAHTPMTGQVQVGQATPQAPFPVQGAVTGTQAAPAQFGIAQAQPVSAEIGTMLDNFFKPQG